MAGDLRRREGIKAGIKNGGIKKMLRDWLTRIEEIILVNQSLGLMSLLIIFSSVLT